MKSFKKMFDFKDKYCKKIFSRIMRILYLFSRKTSSVIKKIYNQDGKQNENFYLLQMKLK